MDDHRIDDDQRVDYTTLAGRIVMGDSSPAPDPWNVLAGLILVTVWLILLFVVG